MTVEETCRIWRAIVLSPTLEICEALLRNETVPLEMLDHKWAARFGLKGDALAKSRP